MSVTSEPYIFVYIYEKKKQLTLIDRVTLKCLRSENNNQNLEVQKRYFG